MLYPVRGGIPVLLADEAIVLCTAWSTSPASPQDPPPRRFPPYANDQLTLLKAAGETARFRLDELDQDRLDAAKQHYKSKLKEYAVATDQAATQARGKRQTAASIVVVAEGPDAAGKGGRDQAVGRKIGPAFTVRVYLHRETHGTRNYKHHYLWRFWTRLPPRGQIAVFDRSWYGRVLVERVEGFATKDEWTRAYREINEFERLLTDDGMVILKFYVHVTKDEQLARFKRREDDPYKSWKINDEDWRNRRKWDEHNAAAEEMFERTSTPGAPWHLIAGNYKWCARLEVLRATIKAVENLGL